MSTSQFEIFAPLENFLWNGNDFELAPGLWIRLFKPDLPGLDASLSPDELTNIFSQAQYWLTFQSNERTEPLPSETVNLVLTALWLAKPTACHVAFRFKLFQEAAKTGVARIYDRFTWLPDCAHQELVDDNLHTAKSFYTPLRDICCARGGRLNNALMLTLTGCWSIHWQTSLICHAAAAEALLTYSTKPGITHRLATSYACLTETQQSRRNATYNEFRTLYSIRSDIMHGRTHYVDPVERLPHLARFQTVLRRLWCTVLLSPKVISVLEGSDAQREVYFYQLASGYTPPP